MNDNLTEFLISFRETGLNTNELVNWYHTNVTGNPNFDEHFNSGLDIYFKLDPVLKICSLSLNETDDKNTVSASQLIKKLLN